MNGNSPPSSVPRGELDSHSIRNKSETGLSLINREESKSQMNNIDFNVPQGLHSNFSTAQAYSIMKNIPRTYRLIEKSNLKRKQVGRRPRGNPGTRPTKKATTKVPPRAKRSRFNKKASDFISSEFLDEEEFMNPTINEGYGYSGIYGNNPNKRAKVNDMGLENESTPSMAKNNKESLIRSDPFDEQNRLPMKPSSKEIEPDAYLDSEIKNLTKEEPLSQMKIQLEKVNENEGSPIKLSKIHENGDFGMMNNINGPPNSFPDNHNPYSTATFNPRSKPSGINSRRLDATDEAISEGDDSYSLEATLSSLKTKSEKLFQLLGETISAHTKTEPHHRVEMIRRIFSTLKEKEWKDIFKTFKDFYKVDLTYFDTGIITTAPRNPKSLIPLTCLCPTLLEKLYGDLDIK